MAYKEKRREERYAADMACIVSPEEETMRITDISLHGVSIVGNATLEIDQHVNLLLDGDSESVRINGVIRNSVMLEDGTRYGIQIFEVPDAWSEMVYRHMRDCK